MRPAFIATSFNMNEDRTNLTVISVFRGAEIDFLAYPRKVTASPSPSFAFTVNVPSARVLVNATDLSLRVTMTFADFRGAPETESTTVPLISFCADAHVTEAEIISIRR